MFDHADIAAGTPHRVAAVAGERLAAARAHAALVLPTSSRAGCGISLPVSVARVLDGVDADCRVLDSLQHILYSGVPLCIQPRDLGSGDAAIARWQSFCECLRNALAVNARLPTAPAICVHAHELPLPAFCLIADTLLGRGARFVYLDSVQMDAHRSRRAQECAAANWTFLWRQRRGVRPVFPVYGGLVKSGCPLLSSEAATALLPECGLLAPAGSHWLPVTLRLDVLADERGNIDSQELADLLAVATEAADDLLDLQSPVCSLQQSDLLKNRRIAFLLTGLGDLVARSGRNPADLSCLQWLQELVGQIRARLQQGSAALASVRGLLPALAEAEFAGGFGSAACHDNWHRHWRRALVQSGVRHRNMLVMSPYSILPSNRQAGPAFTDLLPLIAEADAWSFASKPLDATWNVSQFSRFHRRARAVIQGSHQASFIAAGV